MNGKVQKKTPTKQQESSALQHFLLRPVIPETGAKWKKKYTLKKLSFS